MGAFLAAAVFCLMMAGCGWNRLDDAFDDEVLLEKAKSSVEAVNSGDYGKYQEDLSEAMAAYTTPGNFRQICDYMDAQGEFKEFKATAVTGAGAGEEGQEMAVVVILGEYGDRELQFTITFDTDIKIIGWWVK